MATTTSFEVRPNTGALFINTRKTSDNQPNKRGEILVDRDLVIAQLKKNPEGPVKLALATWDKVAASGNSYESVAVSEPYEKPASEKNPWDN
jgi:hypothetical protein